MKQSPATLEAAFLHVRQGEQAAFEAAFRQASLLIAASPGHAGHELQRCLEVPGKYLLLVRWARLEDHTIGFRQSGDYQRWKALLHHFYDPFPVVRALSGGATSLRALTEVGGRRFSRDSRKQGGTTC